MTQSRLVRVHQESILVGSVASIKPHSVEAQREELPDDGAQCTASSQQKLSEGCRVDCLHTDTKCTLS